MNNGMICVSVCAETADEMIENMAGAEEWADVVEVRFDCLRRDQIDPLVEHLEALAFSMPLVATFRSADQGGSASLAERKAFWQKVRHGFWAADLEEDLVNIAGIANQRILSFHDFDGFTANTNIVVERLSSTKADTVKIAVQANDIIDAIPVWKLLDLAKTQNTQIIPIAMGEAGKWTRILGLAHGAFLTYASLDAGDETAPGQITAKDMIEIYRVRELDLDTKVFGVIGDPVSQSISTYMHNPAFASSGVNAVFIPFLVKDIDAFMRRMVRPQTREVELNFCGFSVTMPHKQSIMKHLDAIDPIAEKIGAINTVKIEDGKLTGYNTDAHGFITPLKKHFGDLDDARVAVFGAGGAARACVYALKQENAKVTVFARDDEKARVFADEFGVGWSAISNFKSEISSSVSPGFDIVVDATPLGMKGALENESLFTSDELKSIKFVYDLVTKPAATPIIREAKKAGVSAIGGVEMLVAQGARQFEIWTGREAPLELMKASVLARMNR